MEGEGNLNIQIEWVPGIPWAGQTQEWEDPASEAFIALPPPEHFTDVPWGSPSVKSSSFGLVPTARQ